MDAFLATALADSVRRTRDQARSALPDAPVLPGPESPSRETARDASPLFARPRLRVAAALHRLAVAVEPRARGDRSRAPA